MRSLEQVNIRTNERTYALTYICTGQTLYPLHNFVVRGDKKIKESSAAIFVWRFKGSQRGSDNFRIHIFCTDLAFLGKIKSESHENYKIELFQH